MIVVLISLLSCYAPPQEFSCSCNNSFQFGAEAEEESYSEPFYCDEEAESAAWLAEEVLLCEEYAVDADTSTCECVCDDQEKCS